jgi:hypothetical protein
VPPLSDAPAVGEGVDEGESAAGFGIGSGVFEPGEAVTARVGYLDAERVCDDVEQQLEVTSGDASVRGGVDGQLGDDLRCLIQRHPPHAELPLSEQAGETGTAWRGGQSETEVTDGGGELVFRGSHFLIHITQRVGTCFRE